MYGPSEYLYFHQLQQNNVVAQANPPYRFELMLTKESAHNFFCFLMCREVDMINLEGVILDHGCGLDTYLLNREPREFQFLRCLVDGSHWQGQKKLKRPDSGRDGHLGCSEGFNFNLYKVLNYNISFVTVKSNFVFQKHLSNVSNSQGREQTHSEMEKCVDSLSQMNYKNFMHHASVFRIN